MVQANPLSRQDTRGVGFMPLFYEDELLYSVLARLWRYMGSTPQGIWRNQLFKAKIKPAFDLQTRIQWISSCLDAGPQFEVDAIINDMTLFNYHAAFVTPYAAQAAREAMIRGGRLPHSLLGMLRQKVPSVSRLRFCPECMENWRSVGEDARWVRSLQLPSTLVCPVHNVVLRLSRVDVSHMGRNSYVAASDASCPADAECVADEVDHFMMKQLVTLAKDGASLLAKPPRRRPPNEWKDLHRRWLNRAGIAKKNRNYSDKVKFGLLKYWGRCLALWGDATNLQAKGSNMTWAQKLSMNDAPAAPLFHMLMKNYVIDAYSKETDADVNFGNGPWPCLNPVAAHNGSLCVSLMIPKSCSRGCSAAHFWCECGYAYRLRLRADGTATKPTAVNWGQEVENYVIQRGREGRSAHWIAKKLRSSYATVHLITLNIGLDVQVEFGWKPPSESLRKHFELSQSKKEMRRISDALVSQPEMKEKNRGGGKFLDWPTIDVNLAALLPSIV